MSSRSQTKNAVDDVIPLGYDSRRYPRFVLSGGGYVTMCNLDNYWFDALRPALRMNLRDISIRGAGIMGKAQLKPGDRLIIPTHQGYLMRAKVVRSSPDPLFPTLFRTGLVWEKFPPVKIFLQWEIYISPPQLPHFQEQAAMLSNLSNTLFK
ncbi:PilZ domain-containing protein [Aeromonas sobria]|uniref:PilZ domain-containing protein n=1 Tax=Aeromonas sobria TaxID=646 RepID=UPI003D0231FA